MKKIMIALGIILGLFLIVQIYTWYSRSTIEKYPYTVVKKYDEFEIRKYEATLFTSVKVPTNDYKTASSRGFSILAGYIFGGNEKAQKIAMTSPVSMTLEDSMEMMFMVPKKLPKNNLPTPNQSSIEFKEVPERKVAAIRFGGWASDEKLMKYKLKLKKALAKQGITHTNEFSYLGYNPPFDLFFRRNEVIVVLK